MKRNKPQVRLSYQLDPADPASFDFYTINANRAYAYGIEWQFKLVLYKGLYIYNNFSLLKSHISKYQFLGKTVGNREPAHAPGLMSSIGFDYSLFYGLYLKIDHSAVSSYYFEDQYDFQSEPTQRINSTLGFRKNHFHFSFWIKNILDEKYITRGYYFALEPTPDEPPHFFAKSYNSYSDPRHFGISAEYSF